MIGSRVTQSITAAFFDWFKPRLPPLSDITKKRFLLKSDPKKYIIDDIYANLSDLGVYQQDTHPY